MSHLFVIYNGGVHQNSLIELHDMRFVAAKTIEDTYPELRKSWWGTPESLHLDAWGILNWADSYQIDLKNGPQTDKKNQLYFVNLGGYDKTQFTELHQNVFVVAENASKAKIKALKKILGWQSHHKDNPLEVENVLNVGNFLEDANLFVHLTPHEEDMPFCFTCQCVPLGKRTSIPTV